MPDTLMRCLLASVMLATFGLLTTPVAAQESDPTLVGLRQIGVSVVDADDDDTFCGIDKERTRQTALLTLATGGLAATDYANALWDPELVVYFITLPVDDNTVCVTWMEVTLRISNTVTLPQSENFHPPADSFVRVELWNSGRIFTSAVNDHGERFQTFVAEFLNNLIADWEEQN
ncbi:MAG: hypothetical protein RII27_08655, partial [Alphaproteobacteria bacterium]